MRTLLLVLIIGIASVGCKNNGQNTGQTKQAEAPALPTAKEIIVGTLKKPLPKPDFEVLDFSIQKDVLTVVVRYSGGCETHDFNAYFSGGWAKSLPPQASLEIEHLNPNNDACRSLVKDTLRFNLIPLRYQAGNEVVVNWSINPKVQSRYTY
jgi:hypothetical protein